MAESQNENETKVGNGETAGKTGEDGGDVKLTGNWLKNFFKFFTVEPFLFCYILPYILSAVAVQKLNMEKACRADLNYSEKICLDAVSGDFDDNVTIDAQSAAQVLVADMSAWQQPLQSGIPAIAILFVGAWSDKTGNRKLIMLVPIIGELVSTVGLILATYYFLEWPLWVTAVIEALPSALSGGLSFALMGAYSYMADVTSVESRTFRMGCVAVIVTLAPPIASAISGILTVSLGYYGVFGITIGLYMIGFLHTCLRIHDVRNDPLKGTFLQKLIEFLDPRNVWDTLSLLFLSPKRQLIQVWLVVWAHIVVIGPVFGESVVLFLYTLKKFNMDIVEYSYFSTYTTLVGLTGTAIAITVFSKYFKMHDARIGIIATTSKVVSSFVYALSPNKTWFYMGPLFDLFGNSGTTVVRSLGTKVVQPEEVGKMCSLIGLVESIVPVIYVPMYSKMYSNTLDTFPGTFYLLGGVMTVPAIFIFLIISIMHTRQQKDVVKDPDLREMYSYENAVTIM